ncbi:alpha/beta fold hydrolase [Thiorhodovibrio frisius]|uniref:Putative hydrolase or acyltransferase of alpha/beta superfamily n=1 Tax=Thiorhodovibrio frisius TaxID=631362 RepID=H8Z3G2_9GAMM|nr:alpha/beta hydrolase [Thiorhodovibrio frisius]EIC21870.1 putative hydrolase or acyltransferase of alpha/beta superfamily [Thiorhodovibrio frisius]WPL24159.1 acetoin dehydrogenase E2 subunit dihydrolipoyllysine-residue acetyltransferase [Thiorhodovibrio frisius]
MTLPIDTAINAGNPAGLAPALDAPCERIAFRHQPSLAYYADQQATGRPLVLIHSINAAPSSFEVKPLFEHYRQQRPVFSLDLPGFGQAGRGPWNYSPEHYAEAIGQFLKQVPNQPVDLLALSLSSEFAVRATLSLPERVHSLVLISPTGFSKRQPPPRPISNFVHPLLAGLPWNQPLFDLVASRRSINYYLSKSFMQAAPQEMLDYAYATSHQPGARHAPLTFLSGKLFTLKAMTNLYGQLTTHPTLVLADRDPYVHFEGLDDFIPAHSNWRRGRVVPNMGLPHWEDLPATVKTLDEFWHSLDSPSD